jgi:hypothetical protein
VTSGGLRSGYNPPLQVIGFIGTRTGDPERGPQISMNADEARLRMLLDGELVYVYGPRRHELATLRVDDQIARGGAVLRDVLGVTLTEIVRVVKLDTDRRPPRADLA